ncbi:hypothetical protein [Aquamicrobium terrae]|uniref:Uncharacterized protein n=1 Tax=Aquamicrobium terrae TaxID=1324945 RepID=A0ABV2N111_9HYPH
MSTMLSHKMLVKHVKVCGEPPAPAHADIAWASFLHIRHMALEEPFILPFRCEGPGFTHSKRFRLPNSRVDAQHGTKAPNPNNVGYLDEMILTFSGKKHWL